MKEINIYLFSESKQFLDLTEKILMSRGIKVKRKINNIDDISHKIYSNNDLYIVQLFNKNRAITEEIINTFYSKNLNWICISSEMSINLDSVKRGAITQILLKDVPSNSEFNFFVKILFNAINRYQSSRSLKEDESRYKNDSFYNKIVTIGASTGGADAISKLLSKLDNDIPPIVIAMHMPPVFTLKYANRLDELHKMKVVEAQDGDVIKSGVVYISPGGFQTRTLKRGNDIVLSCKKHILPKGYAPSIDTFFNSIAENIAPNVISIILTGMGDDGANGILNVKNRGGFTIGQDKDTSVVYGMPKVAYELGAIDVQAPLDDISTIIRNNI